MEKTKINNIATVKQFNDFLEQCNRLYGGIVAIQLIYDDWTYDQYWSIEDFNKAFDNKKYDKISKIRISIPYNEKNVACLVIDNHLKEMSIYTEEDFKKNKQKSEPEKIEYDYSIDDDFKFEDCYDYYKVDDKFIVRYNEGRYEFYGNGKWIEKSSLVNYFDGVNHDAELLKKKSSIVKR